MRFKAGCAARRGIDMLPTMCCVPASSTLRMQHEVNKAVLSAQSSTAIAQAALRGIRQLVACEWATVAIFDFEAGTAQTSAVDAEGPLHHGAGACLPLAAYRRLSELGEGRAIEIENLQDLAEPVVGTEEDVIVDAVLSAEGARGYLGMPLSAGEQLIGVLNLWRGEPGRFAPETIDVARQVADLAGGCHSPCPTVRAGEHRPCPPTGNVASPGAGPGGGAPGHRTRTCTTKPGNC